MGFNKRYIDKETLISLKGGGLVAVMNYILSADAIITRDEFSQKIYQIILETQKNKLAEKLIQAGFYD